MRQFPDLPLAAQAQRWLLRAAAFGVVLLAAVQIMLHRSPAAGYEAYMARLAPAGLPEAAAVSTVAPPRTYLIVLHLVSQPEAARARLLVNGVPAGDFTQDRLAVQVRDGDVLELDGAAYAGTLRFRVTAVGAGLQRPALGREVSTRGDVRSLGAVVATDR